MSGHHLDDQIETVLFRILRGTAAAGAVSMRGRAVLPESQSSGLTLLRPLLSWSKHDILNALEQSGLPHVEDESNAESTYSRNFLRHELLPFIEKRFPAARQNIEHFRSGLEHDEDFFRELVEEARGECFVYCRDGVALSGKAFADLPEALKSRLLVVFLRRSGVEPDYDCVARLRSVLAGRSPRQSIKDGLSASLSDDGLLYLRPEGQEDDAVPEPELSRLAGLMAPVLVPLPVIEGGSLTVPIAWLNMAIKVDCLRASQSSSQPSSSLVQFLELSGGGTLLQARGRSLLYFQGTLLQDLLTSSGRSPRAGSQKPDAGQWGSGIHGLRGCNAAAFRRERPGPGPQTIARAGVRGAGALGAGPWRFRSLSG